VELTYAKENNLPLASIGSAQGNDFVEPTLESARAAIESARIPDDLRVTVSSEAPNANGAYPITGLTWLLVRQQMDDPAQCKAVAQTAWYVTHDAQKLAPGLNYVQIPDNVVKLDEQKIKGIKAQGQPCYEAK
jgi:phosphate transport system substrate-binding protein